MKATSMILRILLPSHLFVEATGVLEIVAETAKGAYGFLPNRLDCIAPLVPGILMYRQAQRDPIYLAVDQGILLKTGHEVVVSVRHAIGGFDLGQLEQAVRKEFLDLDEREREVRESLAKLESGFIRRYMELRHG